MGKKLQKKRKNQNQKRNPSHDRRGYTHDCEISSAIRYGMEKSDTDDGISRLPDEILLLFLSLLPFSSALQTLALSTRWRGLWNRAYVKNGAREDIDCAVGELLLQFDEGNPLKYYRRLQFHFSQGLILLATIGLKKKLHLDFSKGKQEFPRQFGWHLVLNSMDPTHHPSPYTFVKTLNLTSVSYLTNEIVSSLVSNFQCLESLTIEKCNGLRSLRIDVVSQLVNLTVLDNPHLKSLYIEAYELQSLRFRGLLCWFSMKGVVYLEDTMLDSREGPGYNHSDYKHFDPLLRAIRDVQILTLHGWIFKAIVSPWLASGRENLRFSKLKDLWWIDSSMEEYKINTLAFFLKICPNLERLFINIDCTSYSMPSTTSECKKEVSGTQARLRHLKVVKLEGFTDDEDIISLKEHLLVVFNVEPRIVAATHGSHSRCLIRIPNRQSKENMKKMAAKSQKRKFSYKFVEEVEDNIGLCSRHAHIGL